MSYKIKWTISPGKDVLRRYVGNTGWCSVSRADEFKNCSHPYDSSDPVVDETEIQISYREAQKLLKKWRRHEGVKERE